VGAQVDAVDEQLAARLVAQARSQGISLVGPDGLPQRVTKLVLEGELTDHLGYEHGAAHSHTRLTAGSPEGRWRSGQASLASRMRSSMPARRRNHASTATGSSPRLVRMTV
jgi:hypothetical protein